MRLDFGPPQDDEADEQFEAHMSAIHVWKACGVLTTLRFIKCFVRTLKNWSMSSWVWPTIRKES